MRRTGHGRTGLTFLVLRALQQARYDPRPLGHAGLGLSHYCHFTSPIRRYPDLVCHRALLAAIGGGRGARRARTGSRRPASWCSLRERDAMSIERAADDVARCFLLERELRERGWDEAFEGEVTGLIGAGAFVTFGGEQSGDAGPYEGFLPVRRIPGGWWDLNEEGTILRSDAAARSGSAIRCASASSASRRRAGASTCASRPAASWAEHVEIRLVPPYGGQPRSRCRRSRACGRTSLSGPMAKPAKKPLASGDVATNRQARFRYELLDKLECGVVLLGTEVKALREGSAQMKDAYARVEDGELWLHNLHIPPYGPAAQQNHEPERPRKLLAKRREIDRLIGQQQEKGLTIVPTRIYFKGPRAKVEISLARGKDRFDKRQTIKERDQKREMQRALRDAHR